MRKAVLSLACAMHVTASVFIYDDERGLHQDYDDWLKGLTPHEPISNYRHNRTGEACPEWSEGTTPTPISSSRTPVPITTGWKLSA